MFFPPERWRAADGFAALTARIGVAAMARLPGWPLERGDARWRSDHPGRSGWWRRARHPLPEMPKTTMRARSGGTPRVRSAMRMRSARRRLHRPLAGKAVRLEEISLGFRYVKTLVRGLAGKR